MAIGLDHAALGGSMLVPAGEAWSENSQQEVLSPGNARFVFYTSV